MATNVLVQEDKSMKGATSGAWMWVLIAWAAILVAGDPDVFLSKFAGVGVPSWSSLVRAAILVILAVVVPRTARMLHLRGFLFALAAMVSGDWVMVQIESHLTWFAVASRSDRMLAGVFVSLIPAAFMGLTLVGSGISRRELFLVKGDLQAPTSLPLMCRARWSAIAPVLLLFISGGLLVQLWIVSNASRHFRPVVLLAGLPAAVLFAIVNASCEEFRFRCVLLARGTRAFGITQAVATSSVLFGMVHYGGHPSGFSGMAMAGFLGWILARSMVDTSGWGWAWLIHFVQDVIIFLMVLMTGV